MSVRTILRDHRRTRNHNEQFSLEKKNVLSFIIRFDYLVKIVSKEKKKDRRDSEGFENEYDRKRM